MERGRIARLSLISERFGRMARRLRIVRRNPGQERFMRPHYSVYVDFDGTISLEDTTDALLERFAEPAWVDVEAQWLAGRIGSAECMRRQVDLLRVRPGALHAFVSTIRIDPAFVAFAELCRDLNVPLAVVSDGIDVVIHGALRKAGLDLPVFANHLTFTGHDRWALSFPFKDVECRARAGHCKCRSMAGPSGGAVLIGDGRSDYCGARSADFVFAKDSLLAHCRSQGIAHEPFVSFADLAPRFAAFVRRGGPERVERPLEAAVPATVG